jgi:hypothetical protein
MNFFYCKNYFYFIEDDEDKEKSLLMLKLHAEMYALDDKYQVFELSTLAMQKYENRLKEIEFCKSFYNQLLKCTN